MIWCIRVQYGYMQLEWSPFILYSISIFHTSLSMSCSFSFLLSLSLSVLYSLTLSCTILYYLALSLPSSLSCSHISSLFLTASHSLSSYKFESFVSFPIACNSTNSLRISYDAGTWNRSVVFDLVARCYFAICIMKPDVNFVTLDK